MIKIKEAVIVEGTYDKIKLSQIIDATIITTNGFSIFKDSDKVELIKRLAQKTGIVVLTDSDRAGFMIRNYIKQCIPAKYVKHAYIPEVKGVEKRKTIPGKEGLLGVEGVRNALIIEALKKAGCMIVNDRESTVRKREITKTDLYEDGFTGRPNSSELRKKLTDKLNLPSRISVNALLDVLNTLYTYSQYKEIVQDLL
ncbi:MAG: ribonuclease [Clostridiales bacterium]|jgi:ribonuclease M5|nr:ribonuclease [Clostridiales bacterium]MDK2933745.1 ribonuclease [Clostridiales bacterium]